MLTEVLKTVFGYIKEKRPKFVPVVTIVSLFVIAHVLAYKYIEWRYQISPRLSFYFRGYIFKLTSLLFLFMTSLFFIINMPVDKAGRKEVHRLWRLLREHKMVIVLRFVYIVLITILFAFGTIYFLPKRVDNIKIVFLEEPDFDKYAFVYIAYELNKRQKYWDFDIEFDEFNENKLTTEEYEELQSIFTSKSLWCAKLSAENKPLIAITSEPLGKDFFFDNEDTTSVISTYKWDEYFSPPSVYEYLAYSLIEQSILIHLNHGGKRLPKEALKLRSYSHGALFEGTPERMAIKASILTASLTPEGEELLLNSFGFNYMQTCTDLLTLEWLRSDDMLENLKRCFGVELNAAH